MVPRQAALYVAVNISVKRGEKRGCRFYRRTRSSDLENVKKEKRRSSSNVLTDQFRGAEIPAAPLLRMTTHVILAVIVTMRIPNGAAAHGWVSKRLMRRLAEGIDVAVDENGIFSQGQRP